MIITADPTGIHEEKSWSSTFIDVLKIRQQQ